MTFFDLEIVVNWQKEQILWTIGLKLKAFSFHIYVPTTHYSARSKIQAHVQFHQTLTTTTKLSSSCSSKLIYLSSFLYLDF